MLFFQRAKKQMEDKLMWHLTSLKPGPRMADDMCGFVANSNIDWTGAENVEWQLGRKFACVNISWFFFVGMFILQGQLWARLRLEASCITARLLRHLHVSERKCPSMCLGGYESS